MLFAKHLREGGLLGKIRSSIRIWKRPRVRVGGYYAMGEGGIVVDSIAEIGLADMTDEVAQKSGFTDVDDLRRTARHGAVRTSI